MIIFNTTFHVEEEILEEFVAYVLHNFIPLSTQSGILTSPRFSRIFGKEEDEGFSYAMEFQVADPDSLERWNHAESDSVYRPLLEKFREKLVGFSTVMQPIDVLP